MTLLHSNIVTFRFDVIHILNEIHNSDVYAEIGSVISPQGLMALILSIPSTPIGTDYLLEQLEVFQPGLLNSVRNVTALTIFCEGIADELDRIANQSLQTYGVATAPYFFSWNELSILTVITSKAPEDDNELQQLSITKAIGVRYYDGNNAISGGHVVDFRTL